MHLRKRKCFEIIVIILFENEEGPFVSKRIKIPNTIIFYDFLKNDFAIFLH